MNRVAALRLLAAALAAAARPLPATAQLYAPQPARYLLTNDARDARAVWVNPSGLARVVEASIGGDVTLDRSSGAIRLAQLGLLLQSSNLGFGWSHNRYPGGTAANGYALAIGMGDEALSAGVTRHWYRGGRSASAWDVAVRGLASPVVDVSVVWRQIGSPVVRDTVLREWPASFIPAVGVILLGGRLHASVEAEVEAGLSRVRELRAGATIAVGSGLGLTLRGDFSPALDNRRGFAIAVEWNRRGGRVGLMTLLPADAGTVDAIGATGLIVATPATRRAR